METSTAISLQFPTYPERRKKVQCNHRKHKKISLSSLEEINLCNEQHDSNNLTAVRKCRMQSFLALISYRDDMQYQIVSVSPCLFLRAKRHVNSLLAKTGIWICMKIVSKSFPY